MGTVYRVHDARFDRIVALKLLRDDDSELARRLLVEARAQARIKHPHVCRIYEVGEADGEPFICMQYVPGEPLDRAVANVTLPVLLELFRRVALALDEAHRLGIVHRDLKPANILVERRADGALVPYVVDFGLARELVTTQNRTATGAVLGTPAYMAPEQALGQWRTIDERCDVWGLGATLYDLLAGRPPFVADHPWRVLMMVANEEPASLRAACPGLPEALVTIVMKCLEREPPRRYPSARALADDIERFLAAKPIAARPPSVAYLLWKQSRRHKLAVTIIVLSLLSAVIVLAVWFKGARDAQSKSQLAAELGREVTGIELFLRSARLMPLHDIEQERAVVREKVKWLEARVAQAGEAGEGPGQAALGVAYLELGDLEQARLHLERAESAGESSPQLHYALGLTLSRLYERVRGDAELQIAGEAERRSRLAEIEESYRNQGLAHLRAAASSSFHVPAYVEGMLAYYERKYPAALERAQAAFAQAPWLYEAKLLEGNALHSIAGEDWSATQPGWEARMEEHIRGAAEALEVAAEMGRSDAAVHVTLCSLRGRAMFAANYRDRPTRPDFERGKVACARAVVADHADPDPPVARAFLHVLYAYATARNPRGAELTAADLDEAVTLAEAAITMNPRQPEAHESLGFALRARAIHAEESGRAADGDLTRARDVLERLLQIYPRYMMGHDALIQVEELSARQELWRGDDVSPRVERTAAALADLEAKGLVFPSMLSRQARLYVVHAAQLVERGESPAPARDRVAALLGRGASFMGDADAVPYILAEADILVAEHAVEHGGDPEPSIAAVERTISQPGAGEHSWVIRLSARLSLVKAQLAAREGRDPAAALEGARSALKKLAASDPVNLSDRITLARAELLAARWAVLHGRAGEELFDAAMAPLLSLANEPVDDPELKSTLASIQADRSSRRLGEEIWSFAAARRKRDKSKSDGDE